MARAQATRTSGRPRAGRIFLQDVGHLQLRGHLAHPDVDLFGRGLGDRQGQGDVLKGGQGVEQVEILEHEAQLLPAEAGELAVVQAGDVPSADQDMPAVTLSMVEMQLSRVVLPLPDAPMMPIYSPGPTAKLMSSIAWSGCPCCHSIFRHALLENVFHVALLVFRYPEGYHGGSDAAPWIFMTAR